VGLKGGLERRDELLKFVERQARHIQELGGAGLHIGEPLFKRTYSSAVIHHSMRIPRLAFPRVVYLSPADKYPRLTH
jgi:hypothetical protein